MFKREWILPEQGYEAALKALEGELAPYRTEGYFTAPDGAPLYYESVCREENRKAILLLHGFTEFIGKYTEMIGCFFRDGYDVYIFEQRGHGRSARAVKNAQLVHVDAFSSYVRDTAAFVRRVIAPENYEALDLFSHSMGGAVAALAFAYDMPLILVTLGIMYIVEALSDIIQVGYFKLTHGKRVFKMSPFHHHLEMGGWTGHKWKEKQIVALFAGVTVLFAVLSFIGVFHRFGA